MNQKLLRPLLFVLIFLLALQLFGRKSNKTSGAEEDVMITARQEFILGQEFAFQITNNTEAPIELTARCPEPPLTVARYQNGVWTDLKTSEGAKVGCQPDPVLLQPNQATPFSLTPWSLEFFKESGRYRILLGVQDGRTFTKEFDVAPSSFMRNAWNTLFYKPIFNTLVFLISVVPGHSLGIAILLLTILIKLILLGPNQKALKAQKKMQQVQPHLEELKAKHKDDRQRLAQETMALWKKHNVSPAGSCLPLLIQFPILIALFYVVQSDLGNVKNTLFLYEGLKHFDLSTVQTNFFGWIELTKKNVIVLPVLVGLMQFIQMKLALGKKKAPAKIINEDGTPAPGPMMNQMMIYMMPVMIAFFTASMPAAVGFYWGASTLFAIGQQIVVNRSKN